MIAAATLGALLTAATPTPTPAPSGDPGGGGLCGLPLLGGVCGGIGGVVSGVAASAAQTFVDGFADGFATVVKTMLTFWVDVPTPTLAGEGSPAAHLQGLVYWLQGILLCASLLYVAAKTAMDRSGKAAAEGLRGLLMMIVLTGAGIAGIDLLTTAGDHWSQWIIDQSSNGDMTTRLGVLTGGSASMTGLGMGLEFTVSLLGILSGLGQIFFLLARVGILTVLAGAALPLSAAGMATPFGRASTAKIIGWIVACVLYKPAAALVYAGAFTLTGDGKDLTSVLSGLMLIILAVFALPALMRLVVPLVAAASSGGGGALTGAVAGAVLASGARQLSDRGGSQPPPTGTTRPGMAGSNGGSSPGPSAPSGAVNTGPSGTGTGGAGAGGSGGVTAGAGAAGPVGAAVAAGTQAVSTARTAANNATGGA